MTHGVLASYLAAIAAALTRTCAMDVNAYLPFTKLGIGRVMVAFTLRCDDYSKNIGCILTTYYQRHICAALWFDVSFEVSAGVDIWDFGLGSIHGQFLVWVNRWSMHGCSDWEPLGTIGNQKAKTKRPFTLKISIARSCLNLKSHILAPRRPHCSTDKLLL